MQCRLSDQTTASCLQGSLEPRRFADSLFFFFFCHRYEKQLQQEEEAYQQQRRRLYNEVQDEKDRLSSNATRQRQELDALRRQLEDSHRLALSAMKEQFEKAREEQERRHTVSFRCLLIVLRSEMAF